MIDFGQQPPVPPDDVLPCGCIVRCKIIDSVRTMTLIACKPDCQYVSFALSEADDQGKPAEVRE